MTKENKLIQGQLVAKNKGFTLVEVLVSLIIFSIGMGSLWTLLRISGNVIAKASVYESAHYLLEDEAEKIWQRHRASLSDSLYTSTKNGFYFTLHRIILDSVKIRDSIDTYSDFSSIEESANPPLWEIHFSIYQGKMESVYELESHTPLARLSTMKGTVPWY